MRFVNNYKSSRNNGSSKLATILRYHLTTGIVTQGRGRINSQNTLDRNDISHEVHVVTSLDGVLTSGGEVNKKTLVIGTQIGTDKYHDIGIMIGTQITFR